MRVLTIIAAVVLAGLVFQRRSFSEGDNQRSLTWKAAAKISAQNPMFGIGPDGFDDGFRRNKPDGFGPHFAANAHNDILQVAATGGLFALLAYVLFCLDALTYLTGPALGSFVAVFVNAKMNPIPLEAMILLAVICGLSFPASARVLPGTGKAAMVFASALLAIFGWKVTAADFYAHKETFADMATACRINPGELSYKIALLNRGAFELDVNHPAPVRSLILDTMRGEVYSATRYRPNLQVTEQIEQFGKHLVGAN